MYFPRQVFEPSPLNVARRAIEKFAENNALQLNFRQSWEACTDANRDVISLIRRLGGRLLDHHGNLTGPKDSKSSDSLIVFATNDFIIHPYSNPLLSTKIELSQAVFNAAELGHLFLHYPQVRSRLRATDDSSVVMVAPRHFENEEQKACDREAYWYGLTLVFPEKLFRELWSHFDGNAAAIARSQGVTVDHVNQRAERIGLVASQAA